MTKKRENTAPSPDKIEWRKKTKAARMRNVAVGVFLILLVFCIVLQILQNRRSALTTCSMMLDQVEELVTQNDDNLVILQEALKEGYLIRARVAAEAIARSPQNYRTEQGYQSLAELLEVDEIHVFDENGVIIAGSVPTSYGRNMDEGEQIAYFKAMLQNKNLSLCQDLTPNTDEGREMMYAAVWNADKTAIIQVGVTPDRLLQVLETSDAEEVLRTLPLVDGMGIYVMDENTGCVTASTVSGMKDYRVLDSDRLQESIDPDQRVLTTKKIRGVNHYVAYERQGDRDILVAYAVPSANSSLSYSVLYLTLFMLVAFLLLRHAINHYVSYLEKQSAELAAALDAKNGFLRRISHDIRTPINGIQGYIDMAARHPDDPAVQEHCRENAGRALHIVLDLVSSLLDMSKLEKDEIVVESEPFNLEDLLDDVDTLMRPQARARNIDYDSGRAEALPVPYIMGSPRYLRRVFMNLVNNAIKYGRRGGFVRLNVQQIARTDETVTYRFSCRDNGIGMSRAFQEHMYETFSQEKNDARTTYQGSGLGLSIVKKLVDAMDGTLTCQSEKGVGTTFTLDMTFPIAPAPDSTAAPTETQLEPPALQGRRILLAEDNMMNMEIARCILTDCGAAVTGVWDGAEAVDAFSASAPGDFDLIFLDIMMPHLDGLEAARAIRALDRPDAKTIPMVAMSANAFEEDRRRSLDAGMNAHISKPVSREQILSAVRDLLPPADGEGN